MSLCICPSLHVDKVIAENLSDLRETISDFCWQWDYKLFLDLNHEILVHSTF